MTISQDLPPGVELIAFDSISSTNDEAKKMAVGGVQGSTIIWSKEQTSGRGRASKKWVSPPGNLYSSIILRPTADLVDCTQISFLPALAIGDLIVRYSKDLEYSFKWPNDVLLNEKKVSGILLEAGSWKTPTDCWVVVGCGLNLSSFPVSVRFPSTSLFQESGLNLSIEEAMYVYYAFFLPGMKSGALRASH